MVSVTYTASPSQHAHQGSIARHSSMVTASFHFLSADVHAAISIAVS